MASQVWYMRNQFLKHRMKAYDYLIENNILPNNLTKTHILLLTTPIDDLSKIYKFLKSKKWNKESIEVINNINNKDLTHTNIDTGDIVLQGKDGYIIDDLGFRELPGNFSKYFDSHDMQFELGEIVLTKAVKELQLSDNVINKLIRAHIDINKLKFKEYSTQNITTGYKLQDGTKIVILTKSDRLTTTIGILDEYVFE